MEAAAALEVTGEGAAAEGGGENSGNCELPFDAGCGAGTGSRMVVARSAGFQSVEVPQRLQKRMTPGLVAQMSASMLELSIFSGVLQTLQTSRRRPISISKGLMGGKSISQKFTLGSKKATP